PIIHLQQTSGTTSGYWPFTEQMNNRGIIRPLEVLKAIKHSYDIPPSEMTYRVGIFAIHS
ncbi:MAG TPA: hypothetical protein VI385_16505, partial [Flavisolibacter sp.]